MARHVLINYRWHKERGEERWLFWLQKTLEEKGFQVTLSPVREWPGKTAVWLSDIQKTYSIPDENTHIVRHDPGCLTMIKYLERLVLTPSVDTALLVAGKTDPHSVDYTSSQKLLGGTTEQSLTKLSEEKQKGHDITASVVILYSTLHELTAPDYLKLK